MPSTIDSSSWLQQISKQLKDSPGKTTSLVALGGIFALALFRLLAVQAPASARGAVLAGVSGNEPQTVIVTPAPSLKRAEGTISLRQWARQPIVPLTRDLFAIPYDQYPHDGSASVPAQDTWKEQHTETRAGFWDQMATLLSERADQIHERQILLDHVRDNVRFFWSQLCFAVKPSQS